MIDTIIEKAKSRGAEEGKEISPEKVYTARWVRLKCQYGCGRYDTNLTCPPYTPDPEATRKILEEYDSAVLIHFPSGVNGIKEIMAELEREAFLSGFYKTFGFGAGPCDLCEDCRLEEGCVHPHKARPAMEACGINVYKTVREAGYPIEVVKNRDCMQNYYGLLLLE
ncbi:MAG: DUF2284 domain-containing protein [Candidatus Thermoplasmatota archaeon]